MGHDQQQGNGVLFLVHRRELVQQAAQCEAMEIVQTTPGN